MPGLQLRQLLAVLANSTVPQLSVGKPQSLGTGQTHAASVVTITTTAAVANGDLLVCGISWYSLSTLTVLSVSDGTNSYSRANTQYATAGAEYREGEFWACTNAKAVTTGATITVTMSAATGASAQPLQALAARVPVSPTTPVKNGTATYQFGNVVTTAAPSLLAPVRAAPFAIVFGFIATDDFTQTVSPGFTNINGVLNAELNMQSYLDYAIVTTNAAITYAPALSGASAGVLMVTPYI
jgi:hypothetical protein